MEQFFHIFDRFVHEDWMTTLVGAVLIILCTVAVSRLSVNITRRMLRKSTLLPTSSIFINIVRVCVWLIGVGILLSVCFNINVSAIITALGVGGIAVSLGFQTTLSNLIGGLQVSLSRTIEPGDNIKMGSSGVHGIVKDVAWAFTTVVDSSGNVIRIPNANMNTTAVVKLSPFSSVSIPLVVTTGPERLTTTAHHIEDAAAKAVGRVSKITKRPRVSFTAVIAEGFAGTLNFTIDENERAGDATDAAIRAIAPYVHVLTPTVAVESVQHAKLAHEKEEKLPGVTVPSTDMPDATGPLQPVSENLVIADNVGDQAATGSASDTGGPQGTTAASETGASRPAPAAAGGRSGIQAEAAPASSAGSSAGDQPASTSTPTD